MRNHKVMLLLTFGIVLFAFSVSVSAQAGRSTNRGVLVSPARLVATVDTGDQLPPVLVKNATDSRVEITCYVGRGEHRWNGSPLYLDSPAERAWGARYLGLDKNKLELEPGESDAIVATVGDVSDIQGGLYPVIFLEITPKGKREGAMAVSRLAVLTLLQVAGSRPSDLTVTTLDIQQASPGEAIGVYPLVTNYGDVHATFSGYIEIVDVAGEPLSRLPVQPVTVLPGCSRQLALSWQPESLPVGMYHVNPHLSAGGRPIEAGQWAFRVVEPYQVATIQGELVSWYPKQIYAANTTPFTAVVHNSGTDAWRALGALMVMDPMGHIKARVSLESGEILPGGSGELTGVLPPLSPGRYVMRMSLSSEGVPLLDTERTLDVMAGDTIARQ